jgi:hypothetical protein
MKFKNENGEELTLDQILEDSEYQAEFDKKIEKALNKAKVDTDAEVQKKLDAALAGREEQLRKNIQDEIDAKAREAEENAKLTEAEKYKKELDKVNQRLADAEKKNAIADREKAVDKYIKEKGYDRDAIMEFIDVATLPDTFQDRIDSINDKLNDRISKGVNARLKDEGDKVLGGKGGAEGKPEFNFDFQSVKPTHN